MCSKKPCIVDIRRYAQLLQEQKRTLVPKQHNMISFFCVGRPDSGLHQSNLYHSTLENFNILLIPHWYSTIKRNVFKNFSCSSHETCFVSNQWCQLYRKYNEHFELYIYDGTVGHTCINVRKAVKTNIEDIKCKIKHWRTFGWKSYESAQSLKIDTYKFIFTVSMAKFLLWIVRPGCKHCLTPQILVLSSWENKWQEKGAMLDDFCPILGSPRWLAFSEFNHNLYVASLLLGDYYCVRNFWLSVVCSWWTKTIFGPWN